MTMVGPPRKYLDKFIERTYQELFEQDAEKFLKEELGAKDE